MAAPCTSPSSPAPPTLPPSSTPKPLSSPFSLRLPCPFSPFLCPSISVSTSRPRTPPMLAVVRHKRASSKLLSVVEVNQVVTAGDEQAEGRSAENGEERPPGGARPRVRPFELYVCNLPRSSDISDLLDIFSRYGTVQSVEVCRNPETGISRGCGYVSMSSVLEAKEAVAALDGSDLGGRELRVKFSATMVSGRKRTATLNTESRKVIFYEGQHKVYVGNLSWFVEPEDLREYFSQFGTVVSVKLFHDKKSGKKRVYGFLSFSNSKEVRAAVSSSGKEFHGRPLSVREVIDKE